LTGLSSLSDAPEALHNYIDFLENELETPIVIVSVGPDRTQTLNR
jgi:adenylosuccinate synthase